MQTETVTWEVEYRGVHADYWMQFPVKHLTWDAANKTKNGLAEHPYHRENIFRIVKATTTREVIE